MVIDRVIIFVGKILEGDFRIYICNIEMVQEFGFNKIVCQNNGLWFLIDIYCRCMLFIEYVIGYKFFFEIKLMFYINLVLVLY